jgi:peptidoglycan hydrolase-like protein with peptidoglycan-binding domain
MTRPTLSVGSYGPDVALVQQCLEVTPVDGDFGSITREAVMQFQREQELTVDGVVGPATWEALENEFDLPPYPPPLPEPLEPGMLNDVLAIASSSAIARYPWEGRGVAPKGYTKGMAIAWSTLIRKYQLSDPAVVEMAKGNSHDADVDVLAWYAGIFSDAGMQNRIEGLDTLRHLFALQLGLGMRESSGQHCCGRDQSASNTDGMTCEAGLFQMSWNASYSTSLMQQLMDQYGDGDGSLCALRYFQEGVTCSAANWECYGSGPGRYYQELAKNCPQFAVETATLGLRTIRAHWGPINRYEVELRPEADEMLADVQELVMTAGTV